LFELNNLNPPKFQESIRVGLQVVKQDAPEQYAQIVTSLVGQELGGFWQVLEHLYSVATQRPEQVAPLLQRVASSMNARYGIGPQVGNITDSASFADFSAAASESIYNLIDADVRRALGAEFETVPKHNADELLNMIHAEIQNAGRQDPNLGLALQNALRSGLNPESGVSAFNLVASKLRAAVQGVVRRVLEQFPLSKLGTPKQVTPPARPKVAAKPAQTNSENPRSLAEARAKGLNLRDILKLVETEQQAADAKNPLSWSEANEMSDMDILNSPRVGQKRGASRPEDIFDKLVAAKG
jgi:hypothetical protein